MSNAMLDDHVVEDMSDQSLLALKTVGLPEQLVDVGAPGNESTNRVDYTQGSPAKGVMRHGFRDASGYQLADLVTDNLPLTEWALRVSLATFLSCGLVLSPWAPELLKFSVWLPVIAITQTKPTLGDTIKGIWDVIVPGSLAAAWVLPFSVAISHTTDLTAQRWTTGVAMAVVFASLVYTFGDDIQARDQNV